MAQRFATDKLHESRAVRSRRGVLSNSGLYIRCDPSSDCLFAVYDGASGDIPMNRVKMNAKHEYEFIANFKVMQNVFKAKKIDKVRSYQKGLSSY